MSDQDASNVSSIEGIPMPLQVNLKPGAKEARRILTLFKQLLPKDLTVME
jgi:hypothetical protein